MRTLSDLSVSVVVPVHNEEDNVGLLAERLFQAIEPCGAQLELLMVDDGSTDGTAARVEALRARYPTVRLIRLSRNFGHQNALTAGLDHARGAVVITMDGDLQHPPEVVPRLLERWMAGDDIVLTRRMDGDDVGPAKALTSRLFYRVMAAMSEVSVPPAVGDFRLLDRQCVDALNQLRERDRFLRGMVGWIGFQQGVVPYEAGVRHTGRSKYSWRRMTALALAGLSSFSALPLRLSLYLGLLIAALSFGYASFVAIDYTFHLTGARYVWGWTTIVCLVAFLAGIQLIMLGVMGEYVFRLYIESKQRPLYIVRQPASEPRPPRSER